MENASSPLTIEQGHVVFLKEAGLNILCESICVKSPNWFELSDAQHTDSRVSSKCDAHEMQWLSNTFSSLLSALYS